MNTLKTKSAKAEPTAENCTDLKLALRIVGSPDVCTWELCDENSKKVLCSADIYYSSLAECRRAAGEIIALLQADEFTVYSNILKSTPVNPADLDTDLLLTRCLELKSRVTDTIISKDGNAFRLRTGKSAPGSTTGEHRVCEGTGRTLSAAVRSFHESVFSDEPTGKRQGRTADRKRKR